jgi:hypothetical protein
MTDFGWLGVALLIVCVAMIGVEAAMLGIWSWGLVKRAQLLSERLATERVLLQSEQDQLIAQLQATAVLWQPYGRALRWARHPLIIALLESYVRRRVGAR